MLLQNFYSAHHQFVVLYDKIDAQQNVSLIMRSITLQKNVYFLAVKFAIRMLIRIYFEQSAAIRMLIYQIQRITLIQRVCMNPTKGVSDGLNRIITVQCLATELLLTN